MVTIVVRFPIVNANVWCNSLSTAIFDSSKMLYLKVGATATFVRSFSTTSVLCRGRKFTRIYGKARIPFNINLPVTARHVKPSVKGGSAAAAEKFALHACQPIGYTDPKTGRFEKIPEMIPEFVVPDLEGFELKPYVSYKVPEVSQTKFTARDLFNLSYADKIRSGLESGKIKDSTRTLQHFAGKGKKS